MKAENMVLVLFIRESTMNNILFFKNLRSFRCCLLFVFLYKRPKPGSQVLNPSSAFQCCVSFCSTAKQISSVYTCILFFVSTPPYPQSHPSRSAQIALKHSSYFNSFNTEKHDYIRFLGSQALFLLFHSQYR